ncbi:hypothetical protein BCR37DRAFT_250351 [Protomyces lactucae-debilis]|uniref:Uncharacterized protein n=1 Tax=Protomyces lactucae-debilis TaxID=2754530 RepID=A0A1Y2FNH3_PROLT|nr:uncharacterized protein BCR37DRAFT_250351 [Protomyces lactucae-debilis]ORY84756.1 hypothetical protein BCR37DRAFT_250351 [Protomyces lactucae-debilis]
MPSLPVLPSKPASLRNDSAVQALYTKATHEYLDRDFASAVATLRTAHQQPQGKYARKVWLLYMAVLDSTCSLDASGLKDQFGREGSSVQARLQEGTLWDETYARFDGKPPFDVMASLIMSSVRHLQDPTQLQRRVEDYLSTLEPETSAYEQTMELYALHVLPKCKEWDYALEYIASSDIAQEKKDAWTQAIGDIQDAEVSASVAALREEEERVRLEKEERRRRKKRKGASTAGSSNKGRSASTTTEPAATAATRPEDADDETSVTQDKARAAAIPVSAVRRLLDRLALPNMRLLRAVMLLLLVLAACLRFLRGRSLLLLRKIWQTLEMAVKVSYI